MKKRILTALLATFTALQASERVEFKYEGLNISAPKKYEKEIKEKLLPGLEIEKLKRKTSGLKHYFGSKTLQQSKLLHNSVFDLLTVQLKLANTTDFSNIVANPQKRIIEFGSHVSAWFDNFKGISIWYNDEILNPTKQTPFKLSSDEKKAEVKWDYNFSVDKSKMGSPEFIIPMQLMLAGDFSDQAVNSYNSLLLYNINKAVKYVINNESFYYLYYFNEVAEQLIQTKSITFKTPLSSILFNKALGLALADLTLGKKNEKLFTEIMSKSQLYKENHNRFSINEFNQICDRISFKKKNDSTLLLNEAQKKNLHDLQQDMVCYMLFKIYSIKPEVNLKRLFTALSSQPQPISDENFLEALKAVYHRDLEVELKKLIHDRKQNYKFAYNRKRGIYTADDPLEILPRTKTVFDSQKVKIDSPSLTSQQREKVEKIYNNYQTSVEQLIKEDEVNEKVKLLPNYSKSIAKIINAVPTKHDISCSQLLFSDQPGLVSEVFYDIDGYLDVRVYFKSNLRKRLKYGEKIDYLTFNETKQEGELTFKIVETVTDKNGVGALTRSKHLPLIIIFKDADNCVSTDFLTSYATKLYELDSTKFLFIHEITEATIVRKIIDIRKQTKCRWFHDGLANYVAMKIYPKGKQSAYEPEIEKSIHLNAKDISLYDWPAEYHAKEFHKKNVKHAYYYFSMQVFVAIEEEFGEAFIPKWMTEIRKTSYEETTMKTIDNAFKKLTGKDLPTYANNVVRNFIISSK